VKASLTAAIVVRSLWAALGLVWVMGLLLGWVVDLGGWLWLVVGSVVVAVDIGTWILLGVRWERPAAKTADTPEASLACKSPWLVTVLEACGGRLAIEATMEPPVTMSRNQGSEIPDK